MATEEGEKIMRRHFSYANVVATLALMFAMSGGALAATHYLLNSVSQINPRVLAKLRSSPQAHTLYAIVNSEGEVVESSPRATAIEQSDLVYFVNFHRNIGACAAVASETDPPGRFSGGYIPQTADGAATAWIPRGGPGGQLGVPGASLGAAFPPGETVEVTTSGRTGTPEKSAFSILVAC
jgi:hypothetical protein